MAVAKLMLLRRVSKLYRDECDIDKAFTFNYKYVIWSTKLLTQDVNSLNVHRITYSKHFPKL